MDIFANQNIEYIQRIRRHGSYQKSDIVPKSITSSCRNFHSGVPIALNQLIVRGQNGEFENVLLENGVMVYFQLEPTMMGRCSSGLLVKYCCPL